MSAAVDPHPPMPAAAPAGALIARGEEPEIKLYSHSPILYWWPVWALGFVLALVTYLDGDRMAVVPDGTRAEGNKLVAPAENVALAPPLERVSHNPYLGTWFFLTLLIVFVCSNAQMRGVWEWVSVLALALLVTLFSLYGLWGTLLEWLQILHIRINLAGYLFVSTWLFAIWAVSVFVFDRRTYIIFAAGQVRVLDVIGQAEKVYDVTNLTFQVLPNVFIRHRVLGFYAAGDLVVRTGGPRSEEFEWPNVLFARSKLAQIQERLKSREVV